jgi:CubicO group peptidase (beta-lactamase class C family)
MLNFTYIVAGVLLMSFSIQAAGTLSESQDQSWISQLIHELEPTSNTGVAIAIVENGETRYQGGFGFRDRAAKAPVSANTVFQVGSTTKAFASMLFLQLEKESALKLETPINHDISILGLSDKAIQRQISVTDILSHRTGVAAHDLLWTLAPYDQSSLLARVPMLDQQSGGFRNSFIYNNLMYMSLGHVLESLTKKSWASRLQEKILSPLKMNESTTSFESFSKKEDRALPYYGEQLLSYRNSDSIGLAGGLTSNLKDMTKWLQVMLDGGAPLVDRIQFLKLSECHNVIPEPQNFLYQGLGWFGKKLCYGLGWFTGSILESKKVIFHSGNIDGFSALVLFVPEDKTGLVILTNQSVSPFPGLLAKKILSKLYGSDIKDSFEIPLAPPKNSNESAQPQAFEATAIDLKQLIGTFENSLYGEMTITTSASGLSLNFFGNTWPLTKRSKDVFEISIELFGGIRFPLPVQILRESETVIGFETPLSLNPLVPPTRFTIQSKK